MATTGSIQREGSSCCDSREQGEEAGNHHVPEETTEGDGVGRGALCGTQPYPSDRDAGRARGCPSVPLYREAGPAGRRTAESTSPQSLQTLQPTGALSPGGDAAAVDGSRHDWLQGRGPYLTLVGAVDDATGTVPFALFRQQEDAHGYMLMLKDIIDHHGVPLALYSDRHGIFQRSPKEPESLEEQLRGRPTPHSSAGPWRSWASGSSWPTPHRPKAA